ncbi:hypothetical protein VTO42DRAFT_337 [Malbranchea cinnamomea]
MDDSLFAKGVCGCFDSSPITRRVSDVEVCPSTLHLFIPRQIRQYGPSCCLIRKTTRRRNRVSPRRHCPTTEDYRSYQVRNGTISSDGHGRLYNVLVLARSRMPLCRLIPSSRETGHPRMMEGQQKLPGLSANTPMLTATPSHLHRRRGEGVSPQGNAAGGETPCAAEHRLKVRKKTMVEIRT